MNWFTYKIWIYLQITEASAYSCSISRDTVHVVDRCPETEEGWKEAAERKNCSHYAHLCTNPEKLLYHCVVNPYVNQTLEVCAIRKNIIGGREMFQLNHLRHSGVVILYYFSSPCEFFLVTCHLSACMYSAHLELNYCKLVFLIACCLSLFCPPKGFLVFFVFLFSMSWHLLLYTVCHASKFCKWAVNIFSRTTESFLTHVPILVCSICRVKIHEIVNVCKYEPF